MNSPEEKAKELVRKYWDLGGIYIVRAKQCAIIAVEELINSHLKLTTTHETQPSFRCKTYWEQVKQEIQKI